MENVVEIARNMGVIHISNDELLSPDQLKYTPDDKVCILCTGSQGEPLAALSRIVNGTHRYIHLKPTDTVVFSSNPIPEMMFPLTESSTSCFVQELPF